MDQGKRKKEKGKCKKKNGKRTWAKVFGFSLFAFYFLLCTSVLADPVKDKLDQLEQTIRNMQTDSVARNEKVASALGTIDQLRQDFDSIKGSIEANSHLIKMAQSDNDRLRRDMTDRLAAIEERLQIYDMQISKAVGSISPKSSNETDSYQKGLDQIRASEFLSAVASFRAFLKAYPKSELSPNAQYWIGECYFAMKDYQKAIKEFQLVVDRYPRSDKALAAGLKQGFSFAELGMNEEAKMFLNKVIREKPGSDEAVRAKEKMDRIDKKLAAPVPQAAPAATEQPLDSHSDIPLAPGVARQPKPEPKGAVQPAAKSQTKRD